MKEKILSHINENFEKLIIPEGNIKIGQEYPYPITETGAVLELLPQGSYFLKLNVDNLEDIDLQEFRDGDITIKSLFNSDKVYMLIRFGMSSLLHEIIFNPTLYKDKNNTRKYLKDSNLIYVVLIQAETKKVLGIKLVNFPLETFYKITDSWEKALDNLNYSEEFQAFITNFFSEDVVFWWENIGG